MAGIIIEIGKQNLAPLKILKSHKDLEDQTQKVTNRQRLNELFCLRFGVIVPQFNGTPRGLVPCWYKNLRLACLTTNRRLLKSSENEDSTVRICRCFPCRCVFTDHFYHNCGLWIQHAWTNCKERFSKPSTRNH